MTSGNVRHLLLVGGARDVTPALRALRPDLEISTMVAVQRLAKVRHPQHCARIVALDAGSGMAEWIALADAVHLLSPVDAVAAFGEFDQDKAAAMAAGFGLPWHSGDVIAVVYDKSLMRGRLHAAGLDDTPSEKVRCLEDLVEFTGTHGFPVILKPVAGTASRGVVKLTDAEQLPGAFTAATAGTQAPAMVVERYLEGEELSVEAFSEAGTHRVVGVTRKIIDGNFVELAHVVSAVGPDDAELCAFVPRVLDALGIRDGPTHTEVILTAGGPRVVETHTRAGGDQIPQLLHAAAGLDLIELALRQVLGETVMPEVDAWLATGPARCPVGAVRYLAPDRPGTIVRVDHAGEAGKVPAVTGCTVLKHPGATVSLPMRDSLDRLAFCTAVAPDPEVALRAATAAVQTLTFVVDPA